MSALTHKPAWVEKAPNHWSLTRFRFLGSFIGGGTPSKAKPEYWDGSIPWVSPKDMKLASIGDTEDHLTEAGLKNSPCQIIPPEALLMVVRSGILRNKLPVALNSVPVTLNQDMRAMITNSHASTRFLYYFIQGCEAELLNYWCKDGSTVESIEHDLVAGTWLALPSLSEQRRIVAYLDEQAAKIDRLVSLRRRQVELLREQQASLIQHAVTRGLNPNVKMKDRGLSLIGEVPEHWEVKLFKFITTRVDVGIAEAATHAYADSGVPIIRSTNVRTNRLEVENLLFIEPWFAEKNCSKYLYTGDIVTTRTGNAGISAVVPEQLDQCHCFTMLMSTLKKNHLPDYFCYQLNCDSGRAYFKNEAWGAAQDNISVPILKDMVVVVPPFEEQIKIVDFIRRETAKIETVITSYARQLELLAEYRVALIHETVTGQRQLDI